MVPAGERLRLTCVNPLRPLLAVVSGNGLTTRSAVKGGADLILALSAGDYRALGSGSLASFLAYGNANQQTQELLRTQVLPQAGETPVVAGVLASDPTIELDRHLAGLRAMGVAGVTNWPASGFVDGVFGEALADEGFSVEAEAAMLARARAGGLVACGFALTPAAAVTFAGVGCEILILNLGLTRDHEDARDRRDHLQRALVQLNIMLQAVAATGSRALCLAYGGPVTAPEDLAALHRGARIHGFAGGSVFERIPVQQAVEATVRRFAGAVGKSTGVTGGILGRTACIQDLLRLIARVAPVDVPVCIEGESGVGKELVAQQLHRASRRGNAAFVTLNCGAIPPGLLESELFGHEKGAFTGADRRRPGKFELADHGTLFLDEIADLSPAGQVALLRAIQAGEVVRVGGDAPIPVDVRIVCASNRPLSALVERGLFRADLYYRLNAMIIRVPPLRERLADLPILVEGMLARLSVRLDRRILGLSQAFSASLARHDWPGNVRELEHVLTRAALLEDGQVLAGRCFEPQAAKPSVAADDRARRARLAVQAAHGNKSDAALALGISRKTLYQWLLVEPVQT